MPNTKNLREILRETPRDPMNKCIKTINKSKATLFLTLLFPFFPLLFFSLTSCMTTTTGFKLQGLDHPLPDLQKVILKTLPLGKRKINSSGRKFYSHYFSIQGAEFVALSSKTPDVRYFAEIIIFGFRRPYTVEVSVYKEKLKIKKNKKKDIRSIYEVIGLEEEKSLLVLKNIEETLSKRPKDRSLIDDFRIF